MKIERFYLNCLAHASYIIYDEESKEAAVVNPQRDTDQYDAFIKQNGLKLKYVLETHLHADFVSSHNELAQKYGATVVFGEKAGYKRPHLAAKHEEKLYLGRNVEITVFSTPGHTPESVCYGVRDLTKPNEPMSLFTGDTLFVGDVGRPDLLGAKMPAEVLASMLYDTVQYLKTFPDETKVYPAHGAGSACGKSLGNAEFTTIGREKLTNYAMKPMTREEFIAAVTVDQPEAPKYFSEDAVINREGAKTLEEVLAGVKPMSPDEFEQAMKNGAVVLDSRSPDDFSAGSIQGAVNIWRNGQMANWVGSLIPKSAQILVIADEGYELEAAMRCARIGYDSVIGYLKGGVQAWKQSGRPVITRQRLTPKQAFEEVKNGAVLLDVRKPAERKNKFIEGSLFITLTHLEEEVHKLPKDKKIVVHCAGGYRSATAVSLLNKHGFMNVTDVIGGIDAWQKDGLPVVVEQAEVCA
ncbi:MAG: rhodanese-like domain-containing protein [Chloroherpetonaceae bacterium]|nr:rhodanese-like domain-containing protein [Chloroherpetonaceae bacterium]